METTVTKDALKEGILMGERVVPRNPSLPILKHLLLTASKDFLEIAATDLEIAVRYRVLAHTKEEGSVVLPPRPFSQLLGLLTEQHTLLKADQQHLLLEGKGNKSSLKIISPEEFPIIPSPQNNEAQIQIPAALFCEKISQVVGFCSQGTGNPILSGVLFVFSQSTLLLVGTDSYRLGETTLPLEQSLSAPQSFVLPQKTAKELLFSLGQRTGNIRLFLSPSQAVFDWQATGDPSQTSIQIVSRLLEGEYPNHQDAVPRSFVSRAIVSRAELISRLKAVGIFAGKLQEARIVFNPSDQTIEVSARNAEVGESSSTIPAEVSGDKIGAAFNWRFLLEGVSQAKTEQIEFWLTGEDTAALLKPAGSSDGYRYVLMPLRT